MKTHRLDLRRLLRQNSAGFSLAELICVIAIIVILASIVMYSPNLWRSTTMTTAGTMVSEDLAYARELAIANNEPTEVWFLQPSGGGSITGYQLYLIDQSGTASSYGPAHHLPVNLLIDAGTYLSPLLVSGNLKSFSSSSPQPSIFGYGTNYKAWFVRFMPDGSTTLATTQQWYLTIHDVSQGDNLTALPANYDMISIDPMTGTSSLYRP